jgi:hypothetical protein
VRSLQHADICRPTHFGRSQCNEVRRNIIVQNIRRPDPHALTPGADIVYDGTGLGTCFFDNTFKTEFPIDIIYVFRCP